MRDKSFNEIYQIDAATNLYMIEIALDNYTDIFNEWDPAPFKRREIDPDLQIYLEGSSNEIPFRHPIELCFTVPQDKWDEQLEQEVRKGLENTFIFKLYLLKRDLRKTNIEMLRNVLLGFLFLWVATVSSKKFEASTLLTILDQGLFIGGWVFLWEAVSLFFFTNQELYHRYRTYKRLQNAPVFFKAAK
jgi:hypothetical protein